MNRVEIVMNQPATSVRRSSLPIAHHYQGASTSTYSDSSYGGCSIEEKEEKMKQFSEATIKEIVKYRRFLFVILLCLVYAIVGVILIIFKSGQPALMPQITTDEDQQINQQIAGNSSSSSNGTIITTDSNQDHGITDQWLEEPEVINRWHMHNASQSLKHKHTSEGTNLKDCGTNSEGQHYKYGNSGCLFRRATDSDLSGDLCCCSGPVKLRIHHNHTASLTTASPSKTKQTIVDAKSSLIDRQNTTKSIMNDHTINDKQHRKNLMIPNIICFGTRSSKLFNVQKVVPPIAKNSKVTFTVMKSGTCIECSCCQDYPAQFVNRLLTKEFDPPKSRSDQEQPTAKGFWISVRQGLVRAMKRLHDCVLMLYDILELGLHNAKYGHIVYDSAAKTQSIDSEHGRGSAGLSLIELPLTLNRLQTSALASKESLVEASTDKIHFKDYDTYVEIDEPNSSLLFKNPLVPTASIPTTSTTTTERPSSTGANNQKETTTTSDGSITIRTAQSPSSSSDTVSLLNITSSGGDGGKSTTKVTIVTEKMQPPASTRIFTAEPSSKTTTTTTTRGPTNDPLTIPTTSSGKQTKIKESTTTTTEIPITSSPSSSSTSSPKSSSSSRSHSTKSSSATKRGLSSTVSPDTSAKKSIIISLGDGGSKTIITTIETENNESADSTTTTTTSTTTTTTTTAGPSTTSLRPTKSTKLATSNFTTTRTTVGPAILESTTTTREILAEIPSTVISIPISIPKASGAHLNETPSSQQDLLAGTTANGASSIMQISSEANNLNSTTLWQTHQTEMIIANTSRQRDHPIELIGLTAVRSPEPATTTSGTNNPPLIADTNSFEPLKKLIMPTGANETISMTIANNNLINLNEAAAVAAAFDSSVGQDRMAVTTGHYMSDQQSNQASDDVTGKDGVNFAFASSPASDVYTITNNQLLQPPTSSPSSMIHSYLQNDYANANSNATVNIDANKNQIDTIQVVELNNDGANGAPASPVRMLVNPASYQSSGAINNTTVKTPGTVTLMKAAAASAPESINGNGVNKLALETKTFEWTPTATASASQYQELGQDLSVASALKKPEEFQIAGVAVSLIGASGQSNSTSTSTTIPQLLLLANRTNGTVSNSTTGAPTTTRPSLEGHELPLVGVSSTPITTRVPLIPTTKFSSTKRSQSIVITLPNDHKQINITTTS